MISTFIILFFVFLISCIFFGFKICKYYKSRKAQKAAINKFKDFFESAIRQQAAAFDPTSYYIKENTIYRKPLKDAEN